MDTMDLSALSEYSIQTELNKIITDHLKANKFDTKISLATKSGDNYTGTIYRIVCRKLSVEKDRSDPPYEFKIIVKIAPQHQERRELAAIRPLYLCENFTFNEVRPILSITTQILTPQNAATQLVAHSVHLLKL